MTIQDHIHSLKCGCGHEPFHHYCEACSLDLAAQLTTLTQLLVTRRQLQLIGGIHESVEIISKELDIKD